MINPKVAQDILTQLNQYDEILYTEYDELSEADDLITRYRILISIVLGCFKSTNTKQNMWYIRYKDDKGMIVVKQPFMALLREYITETPATEQYSSIRVMLNEMKPVIEQMTHSNGLKNEDAASKTSTDQESGRRWEVTDVESSEGAMSVLTGISNSPLIEYQKRKKAVKEQITKITVAIQTLTDKPLTQEFATAEATNLVEVYGTSTLPTADSRTNAKISLQNSLLQYQDARKNIDLAIEVAGKEGYADAEITKLQATVEKNTAALAVLQGQLETKKDIVLGDVMSNMFAADPKTQDKIKQLQAIQQNVQSTIQTRSAQLKSAALTSMLAQALMKIWPKDRAKDGNSETLYYCDTCKFFNSVDANGVGHCILTGREKDRLDGSDQNFIGWKQNLGTNDTQRHCGKHVNFLANEIPESIATKAGGYQHTTRVFWQPNDQTIDRLNQYIANIQVNLKAGGDTIPPPNTQPQTSKDPYSAREQVLASGQGSTAKYIRQTNALKEQKAAMKKKYPTLIY